MTTTRSSEDLRTSYNEISISCHKYSEPIFITKNGKTDPVVMGLEACKQLIGRFELYNTRPFSEAMKDIKKRLTR